MEGENVENVDKIQLGNEENYSEQSEQVS